MSKRATLHVEMAFLCLRVHLILVTGKPTPVEENLPRGSKTYITKMIKNGVLRFPDKMSFGAQNPNQARKAKSREKGANMARINFNLFWHLILKIFCSFNQMTRSQKFAHWKWHTYASWEYLTYPSLQMENFQSKIDCVIVILGSVSSHVLSLCWKYENIYSNMHEKKATKCNKSLIFYFFILKFS